MDQHPLPVPMDLSPLPIEAKKKKKETPSIGRGTKNYFGGTLPGHEMRGGGEKKKARR